MIRDRFKGAAWYLENPIDAMVGGSGGISSWLAFLLARINVRAYLFDFDTIEEHNLGGQLFKTSDIGKLKIEAMSDMIKQYSELDIVTFNQKVDENTPALPICFSGFDNMQARKDLFESWCKLENREIFIDGRLRIDYYEIYIVLPGMEDRYRETLFNDEDVEDDDCTIKQSSHMAAMIASKMTGFFVNHLSKLNNPFKSSYLLPLNLEENVK